MNQIKPSPILMILGLFLFIYILFSTANSSMDGIGYAADAKWGNELFSPHHLLYTFFTWLIGNVLQWILPFPVDFLMLGKIINSVFAVGSLYVLYKCLSELNSISKLPLPLTMVVGSCFGIMRFSTENETYILPIFWSLLGTLYFLKWLNHPNHIRLFFSGLFMSLACLFHQIHFFWWLGLALAVLFRGRISVLYFVIPAFAIPLAYAWVATCYYDFPKSVEGILTFVFSNFHSGTASLSVSLLGLARFTVSLLRTFIQVHGTTWLLLTSGLYANIFKLCAGGLLIVTAYLFIQGKFWKYLSFPQLNFISWTFLGIIILHLLFAITAFGNSEFMVMIPFLVALFCLSSNCVNGEFFSFLVPFMFTWNCFFGIIPSKMFVFTGFEYWANRAIEHPQSIFLMRQYGEVSNTVYLKSGNYRNNVSKSDVESVDFAKKADSLLSNQIDVYTDCVSQSPFLNTDAVLMNSKQEDFYKNYEVLKVDSAKVYSGWEYLYQLKRRKT